MKIIELLNRIANNEKVPEKIRYGGIIYTKAVDYVTKEVIDYLNHNESLFEINDGFEYCFINKYLNDEVEIIEEDKKIEKYNTGLDNGKWNEESVRKTILEDKNIEDFLVRLMKETDAIKFKLYEIIDKINEE